MGNTIATTKATGYGNNWWDAYNESNATLSDYYMEISRGHFHVVGQAVSVVLPYEYTYYQGLPDPMGAINDDTYIDLQNNHPEINWLNYDKWSYQNNTFIYGNGDGYVDMIYRVFRCHENGLGMPAGSESPSLFHSSSQGQNYLIYNQNGRQIYIRGLDDAMDYQASGLTITSGYTPINKNWLVSTVLHEHGHFLWGYNHQDYGKMMGSVADFGFDNYLSPYESFQMGYMTPNVIDFNSVSYTIDDFTSRYSNSITPGQVLKCPYQSRK